MERKLASAQIVKAIHPIPNADNIEVVEVMGWRCIVKKGEFSVGQIGIFFEVDAMLPEASWSEFMRSRKFRVKSMKMRGSLSQGLMLPLYVFSNLESDIYEGEDVTRLLGITKYEAPQSSFGLGTMDQRGNFPSLVPKTDETRVQSAPELLEYLYGKEYVVSVKLDGSSFTATYDPSGEFHVCSRNFSLNDAEGSKFWQVAKKYDLPAKLAGTTYAVQGELCAPGIQKNRLNLSEPDLFIFNVWDWKEGRHLRPDEAAQFIASIGAKSAPYLDTPGTFNLSQDQLLELSKGLYEGTQNRREGIVVRSKDYPRISFKVINNEFLLKDED